MKFRVARKRLLITPESEEDIAFIEDTLDLKKEGDYLKLKRENKLARKDIAWLSTGVGKFEEEKVIKGNEK